MQPAEKPKRSGCKRVILFSTLVLLCLIASCGYFTWKGMAVIKVVRSVVNDFMDALAAQRIDAAYLMTTDSFRSGLTLEQFHTFVGQVPLLTQPSNRTITGIGVRYTPSGTTARAQLVLLNAPNSAIVNLMLRYERPEWLVETMQVPGMGLPMPTMQNESDVDKGP